MTNTILFSVFGDPTNYRRVSYRIKNQVIQSYTSTKALCKALNVDKTIVFLSFTLYHKLVGDFLPTYGESVEKMKSKLTETTKSIKDLTEECKNVEFVISPGVGMFADDKKNFIVYREEKSSSSNDINLYFNHLYYTILSTLSKYESPIVYVDLTHGINYMPIALYNTVITAMMAHGKGIAHFFNSDPYVGRDDDSNIELNINEINKINFDTANSFNSLILEFLSKDIEYYVGISRVDDIDKIYRLAKAAFAGAYILVFHFKNFINLMLGKVEDKLKQINNMKIEVNVKGNLKEITYKLDMKISYYLAHALLYSLSKLVNYDKISQDTLIKWETEYANYTVAALMERERENIMRIKKEPSKSRMDKRNYLAHVGLLKEIIDVDLSYIHGDAKIEEIKYKNKKGGSLENLLENLLDIFK
ncbi:CRISPR-associated CARF protein Csx1 [Sulfolobus tengchongensis]|uniref:CRISPR-associated CARF protein Csx1 n=1 Tax=Sulfolobus tengchongensis TaxID=207809 RepID=A0AAX4L2A8_9CREN